MRDLHELPRVAESLSFLYLEHCRVEQADKAVAVLDDAGVVNVPSAALTVLLLGPGTSITHSAVRTLADSGCGIVWCGEDMVRFYASGTGETRHSKNLLRQARIWARPSLRQAVVRRLYEYRFAEPLAPELTLRQIRGMEGGRVRQAYARFARAYGVEWRGRLYDRGTWLSADPVNRALSVANACLYGVCHSAIVSLGFSPALGFIHTGKQLSFVYDIADLYKIDIIAPAAFQAARDEPGNPEKIVRGICRQRIREARLLERVSRDLMRLFDGLGAKDDDEFGDFDSDGAAPSGIWDADSGDVLPGGRNFAIETDDGI